MGLRLPNPAAAVFAMCGKADMLVVPTNKKKKGSFLVQTQMCYWIKAPPSKWRSESPQRNSGEHETPLLKLKDLFLLSNPIEVEVIAIIFLTEAFNLILI